MGNLDRFFTYNMDTGITKFAIGTAYKVKQHGAAWVAFSGETTIIVTCMGRQDSRTAWGVVVTEIDGDVRAKIGLTKRGINPEEKINKAIQKLYRFF